MTTEILSKEDIGQALVIAERTLARFRNNPNALYRNTPNSHVKGRLGELALEKWAQRNNRAFSPHFHDESLSKLCDIEFPNSARFRRVEVKTWSLYAWPKWGRCIQVNHLNKILTQTDAVLWCTVDLPPLKSENSLLDLPFIPVVFRAYSLPTDVAKAPVRMTGPVGREIENHQLEEVDLRNASELLEAL